MTEQEKKVLAALQITDSITDLKQLRTLLKGCCLIAPDAVMEAVEGVCLVSEVKTNHTPSTVERICYDSACKIRFYIGDNKKIKAIKEWRSFTGVGLKEAKASVDQLMSPNVPLPSIQGLMDQLEKERWLECTTGE